MIDTLLQYINYDPDLRSTRFAFLLHSYTICNWHVQNRWHRGACCCSKSSDFCGKAQATNWSWVFHGCKHFDKISWWGTIKTDIVWMCCLGLPGIWHSKVMLIANWHCPSVVVDHSTVGSFRQSLSMWLCQTISCQKCSQTPALKELRDLRPLWFEALENLIYLFIFIYIYNNFICIKI